MKDASLLKLSEKSEFIFTDFIKFICSILVIEIHINFFGEFNTFSRIIIKYTLCRMAVPFFFLSSGFFFFGKLENESSAKKYIGRICSLYAVYTAVYFFCRIPQIIADPLNTLKDWIPKIFIYASYIHLWYMLALAASCIIIFLLYKKLRVKLEAIVIVSFIFHLCGILLFSYGFYFKKFNLINTFLNWYHVNFHGIENAFFIGLMYVSLGCLIRKRSDKIQYSKKYIVLAIIFTILTSVMQYIKFINYGEDAGYVLCVFIVPAAVFCFISVSFKRTDTKYQNTGLFFRKESALIYYWHMFFLYFFNMAYIYFSPGNVSPSTGLTFFVILFSSAVFSVFIIVLSKNKRFSFLKKLY